MEINVQQHQEFHGGLHELQDYVNAALEGKETYDGGRIVNIINKFGPSLGHHLAEEIQCLLDLRRFGPEKTKGMTKELAAEEQKNLVSLPLMYQQKLVLTKHDRARLAFSKVRSTHSWAMTRPGKAVSGRTSRLRLQA
jgi:hypothetical protein